MHRLHSNTFSDLAAFLVASTQIFPGKVEESSRFVSVGCYAVEFVWHHENKNTLSKSQRDVSLLKNNFSFKERAERLKILVQEISTCYSPIFCFQEREFLFFTCVKKTISMKILVLRVINSSCDRNCFVRGYIHSNNSWIQPSMT